LLAYLIILVKLYLLYPIVSCSRIQIWAIKCWYI